ncbi:MAG TPA: hypothetical protein VG982_02025 [Candidatus Paceibacterota bacterium]|jgi:hypothetical protein|nr:hypothetical protein [Candidatus Paceibacterota bacterium]
MTSRKTHKIVGTLSFLLIVFTTMLGATAAMATSAPLTLPFGGRIISTTVPTVTCPGGTALGTGPLVLFSNLTSLGSAAYSAVNPGNSQTGFQQTVNIANGIYNAIPYFSISKTKTPKVGDWILGRYNVIPDVSLCQTDAFGAPVPFPVKKTTTFNISNHSKGLGNLQQP